MTTDENLIIRINCAELNDLLHGTVYVTKHNGKKYILYRVARPGKVVAVMSRGNFSEFLRTAKRIANVRN